MRNDNNGRRHARPLVSPKVIASVDSKQKGIGSIGTSPQMQKFSRYRRIDITVDKPGNLKLRPFHIKEICWITIC